MHSTRYISLALAVGTAFAYPQVPAGGAPAAWSAPADLPASTSAECKAILQDAGVRAPDGKIIPNKYIVELKPFATEATVQEIVSGLKVTPTITYKKKAQPGFAAELTYDQVCSVYKNVAVDHVETDLKAATAPKSASQLLADQDADTFGNWPVGQAGVAGAPDLKGLDADCAKIVWYTTLSVDPAKIIKGEFLAQFKTFTKQADVEKMLQNAALKDIKIKPSSPSGKKDYDDSYDVKFIQGTMSSQAICYLLHHEQTSYIAPSLIETK